MYIWTEQEQVPPPPQPLCLWNFNFNLLVAGGGMKGFQMWNMKD